MTFSFNFRKKTVIAARYRHYLLLRPHFATITCRYGCDRNPQLIAEAVGAATTK
ncbi:hypothetical protein CCACVL1_12431 [Corchorus capsularis]|uniref:Uncharacterized protein n=1 Tax=Corchorus capsularis TaxID=210143 RepID=A0A1R3IFW1_COCAP|nr:hypothetical protein CCACVL1_12431 [Corchorus capsularis]